MTGNEDRWEHFAHGADIGIRGLGTSREGAFVQAALAMTAIVTEPDDISPQDVVELTCTAPDDALLLVDWLNAIIFEMATRRMLFSRFEVRIDGNVLRGRAWGETVDVARHRPTVEIKGATYTSLDVARSAEGRWTAQCVVDV